MDEISQYLQRSKIHKNQLENVPFRSSPLLFACKPIFIIANYQGEKTTILPYFAHTTLQFYAVQHNFTLLWRFYSIFACKVSNCRVSLRQVNVKLAYFRFRIKFLVVVLFILDI